MFSTALFLLMSILEMFMKPSVTGSAVLLPFGSTLPSATKNWHEPFSKTSVHAPQSNVPTWIRRISKVTTRWSASSSRSMPEKVLGGAPLRLAGSVRGRFGLLGLSSSSSSMTRPSA